MPVIVSIVFVLFLLFCLLIYLFRNSAVIKEVQDFIDDADEEITDNDVINNAENSINNLAGRKKQKEIEQKRLEKEKEKLSNVESTISKKLAPEKESETKTEESD